ncbi:MAG: hypothetical protein ACOVP4_13100 [Bacteriovoracaceae bacterium]|jgi:hypothetical protein
MKWLMYFLTILSSHLFPENGPSPLNPVNEIKDFLRENAIKVFLFFVIATTMSGIFVSGVVMTITNLAEQYDRNMNFALTATAISGLIISGFSLIIIFGIYKSFTKKQVKDEKAKERLSYADKPNPFQESLLILVNDFVKEREFNRAQQHKDEAPSVTPKEEDSNESLEKH